MLIDQFMPAFGVSERHSVVIQAPRETVYCVLDSQPLRLSWITRLLFAMRDLPATRNMSLKDLENDGFIRLAEEQDNEIVLGIVGKFWRFSGCLQQMDAAGFQKFQKSGYAKTASNFSLHDRADATTELRTETRVSCTDPVSRRRFGLYWTLVKPFSGTIRKEILRTVKNAAEAQSIPPVRTSHASRTTQRLSTNL